MANLNADISKKVRVHASRVSWEKTRFTGVERIRLDLVGDIRDVSTSLLKFAPGTMGLKQLISGGQEFMVLDGAIKNELGSYPKDSYVRLPPGSKHTSETDDGAILFTKFWQFDPKDRCYVNVDAFAGEVYSTRLRPGIKMQSLFSDRREDVRIEHWPAHQRVELQPYNGLELMVINGGFDEIDATHSRFSWLRLPPDQVLKATAGKLGARVLVKEGHLVHSVPGRAAFEFPVRS